MEIQPPSATTYNYFLSNFRAPTRTRAILMTSLVGKSLQSATESCSGIEPYIYACQCIMLYRSGLGKLSNHLNLYIKMVVTLPPVPPALKPIQHYLKTAAEHDQREPVVAYWCRLYGLQAGLKIDKKSPGCAQLLGSIMDWLEEAKKELRGNEAVSNEVVAQAHLENYALKLFLWADTEDRASRFNKNVVKAFYTAGMLFDVLTTFGELTEEVVHHRKYAKWKAAYIHNCLKNGETPIPGPLPSEGDEEFGAVGGAPDLIVGPSTRDQFPQNVASSDQDFQDDEFWAPHQPPTQNIPQSPQPKPRTVNPTSGISSPTRQPGTPALQVPTAGTTNPGTLGLTADDFIQAQKYCKWAGSALQYEDIPNAVENLQKALLLLTTGQRT